jgi:hypothetical protein
VQLAYELRLSIGQKPRSQSFSLDKVNIKHVYRICALTEGCGSGFEDVLNLLPRWEGQRTAFEDRRLTGPSHARGGQEVRPPHEQEGQRPGPEGARLQAGPTLQQGYHETTSEGRPSCEWRGQRAGLEEEWTAGLSHESGGQRTGFKGERPTRPPLVSRDQRTGLEEVRRSEFLLELGGQSTGAEEVKVLGMSLELKTHGTGMEGERMPQRLEGQSHESGGRRTGPEGERLVVMTHHKRTAGLEEERMTRPFQDWEGRGGGQRPDPEEKRLAGLTYELGGQGRTPEGKRSHDWCGQSRGPGGQESTTEGRPSHEGGGLNNGPEVSRLTGPSLGRLTGPSLGLEAPHAWQQTVRDGLMVWERINQQNRWDSR